MKSVIDLIKKNFITALLSLSAILMLMCALFILVNKAKMDAAIETQNTAEKAKFEILFSHLNIVRDLDVAIRGFGLVHEERMLYIKPDQLKAKAEQVFGKLDSILISQHYTDAAGLAAVKAYQDYIKLLVGDFGEMAKYLRAGNDSSFMKLFTQDKGNKLGVYMLPAQDIILAYEDAQKAQAIAKYNSATTNNIILGILMVLLGLPSISIVIIKLRNEEKQKKILLTHLLDNNKKYVFDSGSQTHINNATIIVNTSIENLKNATNFVTELSEGNLEATWPNYIEQNQSLNVQNLSGKLIELKQNLKSVKIEDEKRLWANEGLTKFSELVRNHQHNLEELSLEIVRFLTKYLKMQQGGLFVLQDDEEPYLKLTACFAFERKKFVEKQIAIGEGLVGQTFQEGETIFLTDIPKGYTNITSGLGDATAKCLIIVPMKYNEKTEAIIEMAGFEVLQKHEIAFLEKAGEFVASALINTKSSKKMSVLFDQAQQKAEEMRAAEEELRQNMEEMTATQEEMQRREREQKEDNKKLKAIEEELRKNMEELIAGQEDLQRKSIELNGVASAINSSLANIEFNMDGKIITANENFLKLMGYDLDEIKGKHHKLFVDSNYPSSKEYIKFWNDLKQGKAQIGEVKRITKNGQEVWLSASYTPVFDAKNVPFKVIKFAQNVTLQKRDTINFLGQVSAINKSYAVIEFDNSGNILQANENFLTLMGYTIEEIKGRHHSIFTLEQEKKSAEYQTFWKQLGEKGEFVSGDFKRINKKGEEVWLKGSYNPILDLNGAIVKVIKYALDITPQMKLQQESKLKVG